jgi:hypothetical protein
MQTTAMPTVPSPLVESAGGRAALRHLTATLAYRASKVLRDVPPDFARRSFGPSTRSPVLIVAHMADLVHWAARAATTGEMLWKADGTEDWDDEVRRFFDGLGRLDAAIADEAAFRGSVATIIQAPIADALTHVGQIALLRGMAGVPVRPERYPRAEIVAGRVGAEQAPSASEFDGDASVRR